VEQPEPSKETQKATGLGIKTLRKERAGQLDEKKKTGRKERYLQSKERKFPEPRAGEGERQGGGKNRLSKLKNLQREEKIKKKNSPRRKETEPFRKVVGESREEKEPREKKEHEIMSYEKL